jgi:rhomboid protease GluP
VTANYSAARAGFVAHATNLLIAALGGVFVIELLYGATGNNSALLVLGALPDGGGIQHAYWRVFTFGLLHWNITHLVLNSACLFFAGTIVERRAGPWAVLVLFLVASVVSGLAILLKHHFAPGTGVSVGASGGVFGLLGAALVLVQRVPPANPALRICLWSMFVAALAFSLLPGVSLVGHIAGLLVGVPAGLVARAGSRS